MKNTLGKWITGLAVLKTLLIINNIITVLWLLSLGDLIHYPFQIRSIFRTVVFLFVPYSILPFLLRLILIINSSLKLQKPVNPGKMVKKEITLFMIFPIIASIVVFLDTKTTLFVGNNDLFMAASFLLFFSVFGYLMILILNGLKSLFASIR